MAALNEAVARLRAFVSQAENPQQLPRPAKEVRTCLMCGFIHYKPVRTTFAKEACPNCGYAGQPNERPVANSELFPAFDIFYRLFRFGVKRQ
jgi:rubrerythrin